MKKPSVKFSIRWKLLSIMTSLVVGILVISTYLQITSQKQILDRELALRITLIKEKLVSRGRTVSSNLSRQVENGLATVNLSHISEVLKKSVNGDNELYYAVLVDSSNRVYIHTKKPELELELLPGQVKYRFHQQHPIVFEHFFDGLPVIEIIVPIQISTEPWGVLRLGFTLEALNREIIGFQKDNALKIQKMIENSFLAASLFIGITFPIILLLSHRLSRPLRRLTDAANKLALGDFTIADSINVNSKDEIGVLASAFINMSRDLRSSYLELQNSNLTLEQKVKERTAELAKATDEAVKANQSKSDFLSMVSHEIRTPMNAIIGMTQLSLKTDLSAKQYDYLSKVKSSSDSLLMIINDLLDMSKIEAGQLTLETISFNLDDVFTHLKALVTIEAEEKKLNLDILVADDVPQHLKGDPLRLGQILLNLVGNAIKFTETGGVIVRVELADDFPKEETKRMLRFSVQDSGIGLTQKQIKGLFKPFTQVDISTSRLYGGTGLGLSISKQLVNLMGGGIAVESELGVGSNFTFTFGLQQSYVSNACSEQPIDDSFESRTLNAVKGCNILVVDDYAINQDVAKALLEGEGVFVSLADNGEQAVQMVKETQFDAVLMDLQMPVMDGFEATRLIRSEQRFSDLPIIALTAHAAKYEKDKCLGRGMTDYVSKPIDLEQLLWVLNKYITPTNTEPFNLHVEPLKTESIDIKNLQLSGFDVQALLKKVAGDEQLLCQLLIDFKQQFTGIMQQIKNSLQQEDKQKAEQLIHGLKGVAANLTAFKLATRARELEGAIEERHDLSIPIDDFEKALLQVLSDIKIIRTKIQAHSAMAEQNKTVDFVRANKELNKLTHLCKLKSLDVDICIAAIKECLSNSGFTAEIQKLDQCINIFDFKEALLHIKEITQALPAIPVGHNLPPIDEDNKYKLLIVDDLPINIKMISQVLRDHYTIQVAKNGDEAISIARSEPKPDLILLDIEMPEMNGYELCLKLKETKLTEKIPVIFITGRTEAMDERVGLEMGAVDYITKPFNASVVLARVNTHIELKRQSDLLEQLATLDGLTQIPNRRKFDEILKHEWLRARRSQKPLSVIFMDVDFFKHFNDFFGHSVGDQCLSVIARTLKESLKRQSDFVARYGGEEFIAILPETDASAAFIIAESIRLNVENLKLPHTPTKDFKSVTLSLGLATVVPTEGIEANDLVKAADKAVYEAKNNGRNQVKETLMERPNE